MSDGQRFNPPPGWPQPPEDWRPPRGWTPDPNWPDPPEGWQLWVTVDNEHSLRTPVVAEENSPSGDSREVVVSPPELDPLNSMTVDVLRAEVRRLRSQVRSTSSFAGGIVDLDDERVLQEAGVYRYHHPLENSEAYKSQLKGLSGEIASMIRSQDAILLAETFSFENSLSRGQKLMADLSGLMIRAYNAEAENCIRTLRAGNVVTAKRRLEKARESIAKLGTRMSMRISDEFHSLRVREIELTEDWLMKKEEEKEAAREERARLREERLVERELAEQRQKLEKERSHIAAALEALKARGENDEKLAAKMCEIDEAIQQNDYRKANVRAGYVYVISNRGAFGDGVVKIGLTRRLEPMDRVVELGNASVPFRFDVHCLFFSEDAVGIERELHVHFEDLRVNRANLRREFFFVTPAAVREVLLQKVGAVIEFAEDAEASEYFQSLSSWPEDRRFGSR